MDSICEAVLLLGGKIIWQNLFVLYADMFMRVTLLLRYVLFAVFPHPSSLSRMQK